jgi:transglutaminase-like putative cysteine protease
MEESLIPEACLAPTPCVNADHPDVVAFVQKHDKGETPRQRVIALYEAVRDSFRYDPYRIVFTIDGTSASRCIANGYGHCIAKAVLLAACARAIGVPARLGFADVRNHLSSPRLRALLETDVFAWHGYTELFLEGKWVKATPAFDTQLCERVGVLPLTFDGLHDSVYHPYDIAGNRHMEYVRERGIYLDVPLQQIVETYIEMYPKASLTYSGGNIDPSNKPDRRGAQAGSIAGTAEFIDEVDREQK